MTDARIVDLVEQWRERERRLCRKADGQQTTQYAQRLTIEAEATARCADELASLLSAERQKFSCADCGAEMNEGEAKCFTVCDPCWDAHVALSADSRVPPEQRKNETP